MTKKNERNKKKKRNEIKYNWNVIDSKRLLNNLVDVNLSFTYSLTPSIAGKILFMFKNYMTLFNIKIKIVHK